MAALAVAMTAACGGDDPNPDERTCDAVDAVTEAMETDATAVDAALDDLVDAASEADDPGLRTAAGDLGAALSDPAQDTFGAALADLMDRCAELS
jgi:hypothetical protein